MADQKPKVRILSLNGGGVRGLYTITVLAEFERILANGDESYSIAEHFDLIAGASIGGLLALGLADGKTARELQAKVLEHACTIFGNRYSGENICKAVADIVGSDRTIRDLQRRVLIPTVNITTGKPLFVKTCHNPRFTRDDQLKLVDVARATSAAPTYFEPHYIEELKAYFVDGGLVANNPSYVAYHEAVTDLREEFEVESENQVFVLNIGTMSSEFCINPERMHKLFAGYLRLWGLGSTLVETVMNGNQWMHHYMTNRALSGINYVSLDDTVPDQQASIITLDNSRPEALRALSARGIQKATESLANRELDLKGKFFNQKAAKFIHPKDKD